LVKVVSSHHSLYAYDCWNEPHIEPSWQRNIWATPQERLYCYCDKTIEAFQAWLASRYGTVERLNEAWTRQIPNWKAIDPPRSLGTYPDWVDWRRYIIDRSTQYMHFRADSVRAADSRHVIESHGAHHPPVDAMVESGTNAWRLAGVVDVWGLSLFPRTWSAPARGNDWRQWQASHVAAKFEITRGNAAGKDFWLTELQGGHASNGLQRSPQMRPQDVRFYNWLAAAAGARGIIYWCYHAESTGREATGFGLVARDGASTDRVQEAARTNRLLQMHWDILKDFRPQPRVALLTDQDNALLAYAMSGNEDASTQSFQGYYKALWNLDLWADFIEPRNLGQGNYQVVIVPWHLIGKKETCEGLRRYVEAGGTLILETALGLFDERFYANPIVPPHGLAEAFGYREKESLMMNPGEPPVPTPPSDRIYYEPEMEFTEPVAVRVKANTFLTPLTLTTARAIATCQGLPVAAANQLGKGTVYYIGTNLGASIAAGNAGGIELLRAIVTRVVRPEATAEKVRPRIIHGPARSLLTVFNDTLEDQPARIQLPPTFHRVHDLYDGREVSLESGGIQITVPYQDVSVFLLEP
jgi:hypothetical protein